MCFDRNARALGNYYVDMINRDENYTCYKHGNTCGSIRPSQSIVGHNKFGGMANSCENCNNKNRNILKAPPGNPSPYEFFVRVFNLVGSILFTGCPSRSRTLVGLTLILAIPLFA